MGEKNCGRKQNGVHKRVPGGRREQVSVMPEVWDQPAHRRLVAQEIREWGRVERSIESAANPSAEDEQGERGSDLGFSF